MTSQAQMVAQATAQAKEIATAAGGVVQSAALVYREQARNATHPRVRGFCEGAAQISDYIAQQPGCSFPPDHGTIVMIAHGIIGDPDVARAFVARAENLVSLARVVVELDRRGRSARQPGWIIQTPDGRLTIDPVMAAVEPGLLGPAPAAQGSPGAGGEAPPADPYQSGRAAYAAGVPRDGNPLAVSRGRGSWFAGWDDALRTEEAGAVGLPPLPPPPASLPAPAPNRQQRRASRAPKPPKATAKEA